MVKIDMEMPEKCGLCPLFHAEHPMYCQGIKADHKKKIVAPYGQPRPDWCPLHPLDAVSKAETVTINDTADEIKVTNCNHNAEVGKMVSSLWPHENGKDVIYRQDAIDALAKEMPSLTTPDGSGELDHDIQITDEAFVDCIQIINELPSAQPEPAIPLSWIEGQIEWLKSLDNAFSTLTAGQISVMVNKWKDEQNE